MTRKAWIGLVFLLLAGSAPARAQEGLGVGMMVGEPTGLSMKAWLSRKTAFDLAAAWSFEGEGAFHVHGDYLLHDFGLFTVRQGALPLYYGVGARVRDDETSTGEDEINVGIRIPVGVAYLFENDPFDIFLEVVPILDIAPESDVTLNASLGARYYFR